MTASEAAHTLLRYLGGECDNREAACAVWPLLEGIERDLGPLCAGFYFPQGVTVRHATLVTHVLMRLREADRERAG